MWEAWFLPGLPERQVGLFLRAHHALVDGVAGVAAFGALLELTADAATPVAAASPPGSPPTQRRASAGLALAGAAALCRLLTAES